MTSSRPGVGDLTREAEDEWKMVPESPGKVCPYGHAWDANEQIDALAARVRELEAALRETDDLLAFIGNWLVSDTTRAVVRRIDERIGLNRSVLAGVSE